MARKDNRATTSPLEALANAKAERYEALSDYKGVLDERGNALMEANEKFGPRSRQYLAIDGKLKRESAQLMRIGSAVRRPFARKISREWIGMAVGVLLALLEAPANKFLFDVALQSSGFVSYSVSAAVTAFVIVLAHFAGVSIRQIWSDYRSRIIVSALLVFVLCVAVAGLIVGVLTVARAAFASQGSTIGDLMLGVQQNIQALGPLGALLAALTDTSAVLLACINLGGFVIAFVIAFFSHDSDRDFDHAHRAVERLERDLARVHGRYLDQRARTIKRFAPDLVGYAGGYADANGRVVKLKTQMQMPLDEDDRLVLTDLDQLSENADRQDALPESDDEPPGPPVTPPQQAEASVTPMRGRRPPTGAGGA